MKVGEWLGDKFFNIDGDGEGDPLDVGGDLGQIDLDLLVVALTLAGEVVAHVLDGFAGVLQIAVEDELDRKSTRLNSSH